MSSRAEIIARLAQLVRWASTYRLLIHQEIAAQLHLGISDLRCLDVVRAEPDVTPSRVAEVVGLSTSAASAAIDRLERRGFVLRIRDDHDRRRVFVRTTGQHEASTARLFEPLITAATEILDDYDDEQLAVVTDFLERLNSASAGLIDEQRAQRR